MSSRPWRTSGGRRRGCPAALCLAVGLLLAPAAAAAGVVAIGPKTYSLDGGQPVTGMWEIAEKLAYAKDVAVVVVDPSAPDSLVQPLLKLLQALQVPTLLTRQADYKIFLDRGVLRPTSVP